MKKDCSILCSDCRWYFSVRNKKGRVVGHVCWCWLDGIAGSSDYFYPDERCFEHKVNESDMNTHRFTHTHTGSRLSKYPNGINDNLK